MPMLRYKSVIVATMLALAVAGPLTVPTPAQACANPYTGQICLFPYRFCPRGFALADGQMLPITGNEALFSLIGTQFGGNGRTQFALPDMRGRTPVGAGPSPGPGLSPVPLGTKRGEESTRITEDQLPAHVHSIGGSDVTVASGTDTQATKLGGEDAIEQTGQTGGGQPIPTIPPQLGLTYCISLEGAYPPRS